MKKLIMIVMSVTLLSCGAAQYCKDPTHSNEAKCVALNATISCTTEHATSLITQFGPVVRTLINQALGADGSVDWQYVSDTLKGFAKADGMCVLADIVTRYLGGRVMLAPGEVAPTKETLRFGFNLIRDQLAPGARYATLNGEI